MSVPQANASWLRTNTLSLWCRGGLTGRLKYWVKVLSARVHFESSPSVAPVLPYKRHIPSSSHFTSEETRALAEIISQVTIRYDNLFSCSFAYAMGIHQRPLPPKRVDGALVEDEDDVAHFHVHFEPPLLRSATVRKFLAGYVVSLFAPDEG